jgi:hypothetical protein
MVGNLVAVAHVLTSLRADVPNCLLNVPGKDGRKGRIELPGVGSGCGLHNDLRAAAGPAAAEAIGVLERRSKPTCLASWVWARLRDGMPVIGIRVYRGFSVYMVLRSAGLSELACKV